MNYYDENEFDISFLDGTSVGVAWAKRRMLSIGILAFYIVAYVFLMLFFVKQKVRLAIYDDVAFYLYLACSAFFLFVGFTILIMHIVRSKVVKLDVQERIYFNLYLYAKFWHKNKNYSSVFALACGRLEAIKGDKEMCKKALSLSRKPIKNKDYQVLATWIESPQKTVDVQLLQKPKTVVFYLTFLVFLILGISCVIEGLDNEVLVAYGIPKIIFDIQSLLMALSMAAVFTYIISNVIAGRQEKLIKIVVTIIIFMITFFIYTFLIVDSFRNIFVGTSEDNTAIYDEYNDSYYSYEDDYEDDYYIDASSEPVNDIDIMNHMIALANYLVQEEIIDDFTDVKLSYTAKGVVRGTIDRDEDFEYNLYDNGIKNDENGNECLELVLEAEPLDEEGNSLGQTEAILKGFYLVNTETNEIIDEHKTHW